MASLLEAKHITKEYDGRVIIRDISIHLEQGELVSLLGLSGSGKTTLFHVLSGLTRPEEGEVLLHGREITGRPGAVSYMQQKDLLFAHKKVIDNVSLPLVLRGMNKKEARKKANDLFEEFGLEGTQYQYPSQLSGGMRQRAAFLRTYLSSFHSSQIHTWYLDMMQKIDLSTIFITHDIDEAILLSDRIYLMTGTPGVIDNEIAVRQGRTARAGFTLTQEFLDYKREIIRILED